MSSMQKYQNIIELLAFTLKIFVFMFSFPTNSLIYSGTFSTPKLSKQIISVFLQNKAI